MTELNRYDVVRIRALAGAPEAVQNLNGRIAYVVDHCQIAANRPVVKYGRESHELMTVDPIYLQYRVRWHGTETEAHKFALDYLTEDLRQRDLTAKFLADQAMADRKFRKRAKAVGVVLVSVGIVGAVAWLPGIVMGLLG